MRDICYRHLYKDYYSTRSERLIYSSAYPGITNSCPVYKYGGVSHMLTHGSY